MKVVISGVTGQDGAYLAQHLVSSGCEVFGTSRKGAGGDLSRLAALGVADRINLNGMVPTDAASVANVLDSLRPDVIVNLAGQSSVAASFERPGEALQESALAAVNILEWIRFRSPGTRFVTAGSGDCFGETGDVPATEESRFDPRSPYAIGKCAVTEMTRLYRRAFGLHVSTAFLFNHESPLRSERFVTGKIVRAVHQIRSGKMSERLQLGRLDVVRDWGWAQEYMDGLWRIAQQSDPDDFVIATGCSQSLESFVAAAFAEAGLDWREHVVSTSGLHRPSEIQVSRALPAKALTRLGWSATTRGEGVARRLYRESLTP